jgi:molybdopterin molybdotransferase
MVREAGGEPRLLPIVRDDAESLRGAIRAALDGVDVLLTIGGVSVGDHDLVRPMLVEEGVAINFWRVAIKPGKPLAFGTIRRADGTASLLVGLPGNPVSAFVTHLLAVTTVLQTLQGMPASLPKPQPMRADFDWPKPDRRREFLRVRLNAQGGLDLYPNQSSGVLTSVVWADGLVDNPASRVIARGDTVDFLPLSELVGR